MRRRAWFAGIAISGAIVTVLAILPAKPVLGLREGVENHSPLPAAPVLPESSDHAGMPQQAGPLFPPVKPPEHMPWFLENDALALTLTVAADVPCGSPCAAVRAAYRDLLSQPIADQHFLRYLYAPLPTEERADFKLALKLHCNLLSRESDFGEPLWLCPDLVRVDLRDYQWQAKVFEKLATTDPYYHKTVEGEEVEHSEPWPGGIWPGDGKEYAPGSFNQTWKEKKKTRLLFCHGAETELGAAALLASSEAVILRADWFLAQSARQLSLRNKQEGTGYYDFLRIKDRNGYFALIGLDEKLSVRLQKELRAVVDDSGVSAQNRQIVALNAVTGRNWQTLDTFTQQDKGIAIKNLRRGEFNHDAEEHYSFLPNGLPVTYLSDAAGTNQASAPDQIGGNSAPLNTARDLRIHVNLACMQCHAGQVLQPIDDVVRKTYVGSLKIQSPDKKVYLELKRQYGRSIDVLLEKDRINYRDAFQECVKLTPQKATEIYSAAFSRYAYRRLTAADAAREIGCTEGVFLTSLKKINQAIGAGDFRFDPWLADTPGTVTRLSLEDGYQTLVELSLGVVKP